MATIATLFFWLSVSAWSMGVEQIVSLALQSNPQVRAARARWLAAEHSVVQNYAPVDPIFSYGLSIVLLMDLITHPNM